MSAPYTERVCEDCGRKVIDTVNDGVDRHAWNCDQRLALRRRVLELEWLLFLASRESQP
jgi:hypothetical protein